MCSRPAASRTSPPATSATRLKTSWACSHQGRHGSVRAARERTDQQRETDRERVEKLIWRGVGVVSVLIVGVGGVIVGAFAAFGG